MPGGRRGKEGERAGTRRGCTKRIQRVCWRVDVDPLDDVV